MDERAIHKVVIASIIGHPAKEHYASALGDGRTSSQIVNDWYNAGGGLRKADIFAEYERGKSWVTSAQFWRSYKQINEELAKNNEQFEPNDFTRLIDRKTVMKWAEAHQSLGHVFDPEIWKDNEKEMMELWYQVSAHSRTTFETKILDVRRQIAQMNGKTLREDRLRSIGVDVWQLQYKLKHGEITPLMTALRSKGEKLTKEDLMLPERDGDTIFCATTLWDHLEEISDILAENGEYFTADDFLVSNANHATPLRRAISHGKLGLLFNPKIWVGRVDEMVKLWNEIGDYENIRLDIDGIVLRTRDLTYEKALDVKDLSSLDAKSLREELFKPMTLPQGVAGGDNEAVIPMMLDKVWKNFEKVQNYLVDHDTPIRMSDLRKKDAAGNSLFYLGIRYGHFETIAKSMHEIGDELSIGDLIHKNADGQSALDMIAQKGELKTLFNPDYWVGRVFKMQTLFERLNEHQQKQFIDEYRDVLAEVNRRSVYERSSLRRKIRASALQPS